MIEIDKSHLNDYYHNKINVIYYGNNLEIVRKIPNLFVDLIYIDPLFCSNRIFGIWSKDKDQQRIQKKIYNDCWNDGDKSNKLNWEKRIESYKKTMTPIIFELCRILKNTGSFYLHCDHHADAYLQIICDDVFKRQPNSVIYWVRSNDTGSSKSIAKKYPICTDTILYYTKSDDYTWHKPTRNVDTSKFKINDNDGKGYYYWADLKTYSKERFVELKERNETKERKSGKYSYKRFLNGLSGETIVPNFWDDISRVTSNSKEYIEGYMNQKPERLMERIISTSSNEGDIVFDCYCGSGTTLFISQKLKRKFIGIDVDPYCCELSANRLKYDIRDIIYYKSKKKKEEILKMEWFEFQLWVCGLLHANSNKRGRDDKVDGETIEKATNKRILIQVKFMEKENIKTDYIYVFCTAIKLRKLDKGIFVAISIPNSVKQLVKEIKGKENVEIILHDINTIQQEGITDIYEQPEIVDIPNKQSNVLNNKNKLF